MVNNSLQTLCHWLLPHCCVLCHRKGQAGLDLCEDCQQDLPVLGPKQCNCCALPLTHNGSSCADCLKSPPSFKQLWAAWHYAHPIDELINHFKNHYGISAGKVLSQLLARHIANNHGPMPDCLIPTPLHWRRLLSRGFNQSELIAGQLSRQLGIPLQPCVKRIRHTPKQQQLSAKQRRRNLKQAFIVANPKAIQGKRVALVDDVVTTCSTAELISQLLIQAGAAEVYIWCLARTPSPD